MQFIDFKTKRQLFESTFNFKIVHCQAFKFADQMQAPIHLILVFTTDMIYMLSARQDRVQLNFEQFETRLVVERDDQAMKPVLSDQLAVKDTKQHPDGTIIAVGG